MGSAVRIKFPLPPSTILSYKSLCLSADTMRQHESLHLNADTVCDSMNHRVNADTVCDSTDQHGHIKKFSFETMDSHTTGTSQP